MYCSHLASSVLLRISRAATGGEAKQVGAMPHNRALGYRAIVNVHINAYD